ncbi:MAG TPA: penicillin-binding transpeptidase domain-containing protein, partial [Candidatus Avimonas sp.]|nr:penicillin-binding transpeptidase domain-containing protein [Candidatus Avimonas sp.]
MQRDNFSVIKRRAITLIAIIAFIFGGYSIRLFQIQIVEGEKYSNLANKSSSIEVPIQASRGEIVDRYLTPMAINRTSFSIIFDGAFFPRGNTEEQQRSQNEIILSLTKLLAEAGCEWNDTLPITKTKPYQFLEDKETSVKNLKAKLKMADYATAEQCMNAMVEQYELSGYTDEQKRIIAGVRYEMDIRQFSIKNPFTFSSDVTEDVYNKILENSPAYPGVNVQTTPVREYVSKNIACHLIGTVGPIYAEEYAELKDKGYQLSDILGKSGVEAALESELRGINGTNTVTKDASGNVVEKKETKSPVPGNTVVLTLDYNLQKTTQAELDKAIKQLRSQSTKLKGEDVRSGSVVMLDVKTGGVLVCASWPDFDLSTYNADYSKLVQDKDKPLFNRALYGTFPCGSTMKPGVALAGINEGIITRNSVIAFCDRTYDFYPNLTLGCLGYHGNVTVVRAIADSCNVFFYDLGRRLGIDKMNEYSKMFGLGQKTGIEIGEAEGILAGRAQREKSGGIWYPADTSQAAIGQSDNMFTPIQLAAYAMTMANDGVRYKTHLVKSIRSYDGTEKVVQPEVVSKLNLSKEAIDAVREG